MEFQEKNWNAVSELTDQLSELSPELPEAYYYGGLARYSSGQIEEAEKSLRWLDERGLCGRYPLTYFYLGVIDSKRGEIELAATELRLFLKSTPEAQVPPDWRKKITEQLAQWQEQGLIEGE
jgi:tetratricopeptide (TPR) repeat protein